MKIFKLKKERGASAVEYALLVALVALMGVASVQALGTAIAGRFDKVGNELQGTGTITNPESQCNPPFQLEGC